MELRIGTWNVRTLLSLGKMMEVAEQLDNHRMDITAIQEIRWKDNGVFRKKDFHLYYSGAARQGFGGVGFIVNKKTSKAILGFTPINDRICKLKIKGRFHNISLISVYAPTEEAEELTKTQFYETLQKVIDTCTKSDCVIVLGDLNAKIGQEEIYNEVIGRHSLHSETNENGKWMVQMAVMNDLKVVSTFFPHKKIHKGTWTIPGTADCNQIDHVLISKRWATSVQDVRVYRGANCDSDHFLVVSRFQHRISNIKKMKPRKLQSAEQLKDSEKVKEYRKKLQDKLAVDTNNNSIEDEWIFLKDSIIEATKEILDDKPRKRKEWFDDECRNVLKTKNDSRLKLLQNTTRRNKLRYEQHRKEANTVCRRKKKLYLRGKVEELLESFRKNDNRKFYKDSKSLIQKFNPRVLNCKGANGQILADSQEIKQRWKCYFQTLLSTEEMNETRTLVDVNLNDIDVPEPTFEDMMQVIKKLRRNKAPGSDGIRAEFLKEAGENVLKRIYKLILQIWKEEEIPNDWKMGLIVPIYKKGDKLECSNYRGITLLNVTYKIFTCLIYQKLVPFAEKSIGEYQCGFRANHSTIEQIHTVRNIFEKFTEYNIDLFALFVDFKQAFDRVDRKKLVDVLAELNIPMKLINLIDITLKKNKAAVIVQNELTDDFEINAGVRQGDALSPVLFNLILEHVVRQLDLRGCICNKTSQICAFADDIVILSRSKPALISIARQLIKAANEVGLKINAEKTKYMEKTKSTSVHISKLSVDNLDFERVHSFTYLGSIITDTGKNSEELHARLLKGNRVFFLYNYLLKNKLLSRPLKMRLYKTILRPIVTYGCETWTLTKKDENDLLIFERKILRKILGPVQEFDQWRIRTNLEIERIIKGENIVRFIKAQRLSWLGHIERSEKNNGLKRILNWTPMGTRPRGRPKKRWKDDVLEDLSLMKVRNWRNKVNQRAVWNQIVSQAKAHKEL